MGGITIVYGDVIRIWVGKYRFNYVQSREDFKIDEDPVEYKEYVKNTGVTVLSCKELASWLD